MLLIIKLFDTKNITCVIFDVRRTVKMQFLAFSNRIRHSSTPSLEYILIKTAFGVYCEFIFCEKLPVIINRVKYINITEVIISI